MDFDAVLMEPRRAAMEANGFWHGKTVNDCFDAWLAAAPDAHALTAIRAATGERRDFFVRELDRLADRAAVGLYRLGVRKADVVACQMPNGWEFVVAALACARIGAVFDPVMPIFRERELRFMLKHGEAKVFLVPAVFRNFDHKAMAERMRPELPDLAHVVVQGDEDETSFARLLLDPAFDDDPDRHAITHDHRPTANEVCQLVYTSGTTGEPKGVMHTANTLYSNLIPYAERLGLGADTVVFMASPMAHQTGFMYGHLMPLHLQARTVLLDSWDKALAARLIAEERCTFTMAATPFLSDLAGAVEEGGIDSASLRIFVCAGAAIPGPVVARARKILGAKIVSAWGMTENGAVTTTDPADPDARSVESDGCPLPGMELEIRNADGTRAGDGEEGALFVRGASNFVGYLKRPHWNNVDADGWFDTGDLARRDAAGYIRICGRSKDVIIRGAENIPVVEVESLLFEHPAVAAAVVVGYPDERLGERACAFVVPKAGQTLTFAEMTAFLENRRLARPYFPERLEIRDSLPATASGKIQKFVLRSMLREETSAARAAT
ncbi:Long-chain-fatty-acid--CoA ligase [Rhodovulum sp. PH10]|uniref:cyclohexanecarboxylate-CoA ligase n=1 Tax=Rhodovulum sp. PH10 TaxID=1187851 RepID=UPI00027C238C|nr:cyclohexanecarboxylate-CoA ligase [Rhodovulum sp. PH10]EJW11385.1 Long-chain-fatty-acid--CoA ligase [Rhodovulum sp. PH10]